jgi:hypothetical protein
VGRTARANSRRDLRVNPARGTRDKASRRKSGVRDFRKALITNGHSPNLRIRNDDSRLTPIGVSIPRAPERERIKEADVEPGEIVDVARYNDHIIDQRRGGDQDILVQGVRSLVHQARVQSKHRGIQGKNGKSPFNLIGPGFDFARPGRVAFTRDLDATLNFSKRYDGETQIRGGNGLDPGDHRAMRTCPAELLNDIGVEKEHDFRTPADRDDKFSRARKTPVPRTWPRRTKAVP